MFAATGHLLPDTVLCEDPLPAPWRLLERRSWWQMGAGAEAGAPPKTPKMPERIVYRLQGPAGGSRPSTTSSGRRPAPPAAPRKVRWLSFQFTHPFFWIAEFADLQDHSPLSSAQMHRSMYGVVPRTNDGACNCRRYGGICAILRYRIRYAVSLFVWSLCVGSSRCALPTAFPQATPRFATLSDLLSHRCAAHPACPEHCVRAPNTTV